MRFWDENDDGDGDGDDEAEVVVVMMIFQLNPIALLSVIQIMG